MERNKDTTTSDRYTIIYSDGIYSNRHPSFKSTDSISSSNNSTSTYKDKEGPSGGNHVDNQQVGFGYARAAVTASRDVPLRDLIARYLTGFHSALWETFAADLNRLPPARLSAVISADLSPRVNELCHELLRSLSIRVDSFITMCGSSTLPMGDSMYNSHGPDTTTLWFLRRGMTHSLDNIMQDAFSFLDSNNDGLLDEQDFKFSETSIPTKSDQRNNLMVASQIRSTQSVSPNCFDREPNSDNILTCQSYASYEMMSSIDKVSPTPPLMMLCMTVVIAFF